MNKERLDYVFETYKPVQNKEEITWLLDKIESTIGKPKVALEIGVEHGGTAGIWKEILDENGILIGIDVGRLSENKIYDSSKRLFFVQGDSRSDDVLERAKKIMVENGRNEDGIDYIFIDGSHDYFVVKSDYEKYSKLIGGGKDGKTKKGLVGFHDIWMHDQSTTLQNVDLNDGFNGSVTRFWLELTEDFKMKGGDKESERKYPEIKRLEFMQARSGFNIGIGCLWVEW